MDREGPGGCQVEGGAVPVVDPVETEVSPVEKREQLGFKDLHLTAEAGIWP